LAEAFFVAAFFGAAFFAVLFFIAIGQCTSSRTHIERHRSHSSGDSNQVIKYVYPSRQDNDHRYCAFFLNFFRSLCRD
jgi:hypothetical protein